MKVASPPFSVLVLLFFLLSFSTSISAQLAPHRYQVTNKSRCKAIVKVGCTDNNISQYIMQPDGFVNGDCGDGIEVCFISIDFFDGNIGPERIAVNPFFIGFCASPLIQNIASPGCYAGNLDWNITTSGFITMNFY